MTELTLYFLKTQDSPSMLLTHAGHSILFDAPPDIDPPYDPTAVFMTDRKDELVKSASALADRYGVGLLGAGQLFTDDLTITPFVVKSAIAKSYGYIIKSENISIAYAPHFDAFPREVLGADVVILDGRDPNTVQMAKRAGCRRIMTVKSTIAPWALEPGQVLSLVTKTKPTMSKMATCYRDAMSTEGACADCRYYVPPASEHEMAKGDIDHPDVTDSQIRIRLRPPSDFEPGSFRNIQLGTDEGISAVIGKPRGQESTATQSLRFDRASWSEAEASAWAHEHHPASKSATARCTKVIGNINPEATCDIFEPATLAPMTKVSMFAKVQQAFGSPGGKRAMAKRILQIMPEHNAYVEPYAGGAAVYFAKPPERREILNDLDTEIAQTYKDMQGLSDVEIRQLQGMPWTVNKNYFKQLKKSTPTGKLARLHRWLYMRGAAYGNYTQPSASHEGKIMKVANRLGQIRDRMGSTIIMNDDALNIIKKFDSPDTFFFLDPPYPTEWKFDGNTGHADSNEWNGAELFKLLEVLKAVKGKFLLTLESEIEQVVHKHAPEFVYKRIPMARQMSLGPKGKLSSEDELIVANYAIPDMQKSLDLADVHVDKPISIESLKDDEGEDGPDGSKTYLLAKSVADELRLVWTVNMVPNKVDGEGHWQDEAEIMRVAHNFMLKDVPIWSEHKQPVRSVFPVQSYTLLADLKIGDRVIPAGSWITVLWVPNDEEWAKVKSGEYRGTSIRGFSRRQQGSPPAEKRLETQPVGA